MNITHMRFKSLTAAKITVPNSLIIQRIFSSEPPDHSSLPYRRCVYRATYSSARLEKSCFSFFTESFFSLILRILNRHSAAETVNH